ncbi:MAG TPA: glutamine--fructose-6-phosphate transaminase (isomerizing), partial [Polyangiaceae bacterium]|nr:glutamine--fructose-6-phosphate transaminase (isomerizing) [Polyangiaceae bacterium]
RAVGKLANLNRALSEHPLPGSTGLGHTRWATHGRPSEQNAHPHVSKDVAVVHNGIIENHLELKHRLQSEGIQFASDTDTEIAAHLVQGALDKGAKSLFEAVRTALREIRGAYALAVVSTRDPGLIVVAKNASPLVLGLAEGASLCASDIPAMLEHTRDVIFMEDGELAELKASGIRIETLDGKRIERAPKRVMWNPMQAEKAGFKHFMLKEIFEQPRAVEDTLRGRVNLEDGSVEAAEIGIDQATAKAITRVYFVACGTSHHAAIAGRYWVEQFGGLPAQTELASEVRYRDPVFTKTDLVVAVSQSGETADTLAALKSAREAGARILAVANVVDSAIPRSAHSALYTHAGPEIGVASTKCYTTQLVALLLLAVHLGRCRGKLDAEQGRDVLEALLHAPEAMRETLANHDAVLEVAKRFQRNAHMLFLGRGLGFPTALEGALKLKEISYAHAEGYAAGEMKHGPIALIDEDMPVVVVVPSDRHYEKTLSNLQEVRAREGQVIAVATVGNDQVAGLAQHVLRVPVVADAISPLVTVIPLQLLSYYIADLKGTDVDQPRNLAKTVTV